MSLLGSCYKAKLAPMELENIPVMTTADQELIAKAEEYVELYKRLLPNLRKFSQPLAEVFLR
jgi:hypothetical protein